MADQVRSWPPQKVAEILRELLEDDKTLKEIANRERVTKQFIQQLTGNLNRGHSRAEAKQAEVKRLYLAGKTEEQIAADLRLSPGTVSNYRLKAELRRPKGRKRHSIETSIRYAQLWFDEYGFTPGVADWSPSHAAKLGHTERIDRLKEFSKKHGRPPVHSVIQQLFGTWSKFIRQAGLQPAPTGYPARGRFKVEKV